MRVVFFATDLSLQYKQIKRWSLQFLTFDFFSVFYDDEARLKLHGTKYI